MIRAPQPSDFKSGPLITTLHIASFQMTLDCDMLFCTLHLPIWYIQYILAILIAITAAWFLLFIVLTSNNSCNQNTIYLSQYFFG